jgi:hypothetical protein
MHGHDPRNYLKDVVSRRPTQLKQPHRRAAPTTGNPQPDQHGTYPTKSSLKGRYNEYQQKFDLPAGYAGREPRFSQEQKRQP